MRHIRLRTVALALAGAALILGACTSGDNGDAEGDGAGGIPPTVITSVTDSRDPAGGGIEPANPDAPPQGTLASSSDRVPLGLGSYCWSPPAATGQPAMCADAIGIITATEDLDAAPGEVLTIAGEAGTLPWPPMTIAHAALWPAPAEPFDAQPAFRAWHPDGDEVVVETREEIGEHSILLPADLEPGRYILVLNYTAGPDRGSDATYGAVIVIR
jgi:hypothetical protein